MDPMWYGRQYRITNQEKVYAAKMPDMLLLGKLDPIQLLPPEYRQTAGQPKKRKDCSKMQKMGNKEYTCGACGGKNHNELTCPNPSTQYCVKKHKKKAKEWAYEASKLGFGDLQYD